MHWEVQIPGDDTGGRPWTGTVEAANWFSALRNALSTRGIDGNLISNVTCDIKPDRSVHVTDFVTRKVFVLRVVETPEPATAVTPVASPAPKPAPTANTAAAEPAEPALLADLPLHEVFFRRDEAPDDGSNIFYRERLIAVDPEVSFEEAGRLALAVYERLRDMGASGETRLFVTVQVFDHVFEQRSKRPPVAALTWKEWSPRKGKIDFPLSGEQSLSIGQPPRISSPPAAAPTTLPPPAVEPPQVFTILAPMLAAAPVVDEPVDLVPAVPAPAPVVDRPVDLVPAVPAPAPVVDEPVDLVPAVPVPAPVVDKPVDLVPPAPAAGKPAAEPPRQPTPVPPRSTESGIEDQVVHAFERMHELYSIREHDAAARFALDLCREFVACEAGSAMLITPGKYELYIAAAVGPVAEQLLGRKMSLTKGIIGFATRTSAVITVSDPMSDPRFHGEFDTMSGFMTRNVVCAPIQHEGRTIGAIELINSVRPAGFLQSEANVLSYIAGSVGEYIDNSLPSREADFSDKEFIEFLPTGRTPGTTSKAVGKAKGKAAPAAGKAAATKPAKEPAKAGAAPAATKPAAEAAKKIKKKRKR